MSVNALTELLEEAIEREFQSPENLSRRAGLAPGTVRNILKSGRGSDSSLEKLGLLLGRSKNEMMSLAGRIADEQELTRFQRDVLAVARDVKPHEEKAFLIGVLSALQGLRVLQSQPGFPTRLLEEDRREDQ